MCEGELPTELSPVQHGPRVESFLGAEDKLFLGLEQLILAHGVPMPLTSTNIEPFGGVILPNNASIALRSGQPARAWPRFTIITFEWGQLAIARTA